jgi:hypothetical protein
MKPHRPSAFAGAVPIDGRGRRSNETLLRLDERNKMLIEIAHRFYGGLSHLEAAHRLRSRLLIYRSGRWQRSCLDLRSPHPPEKIETLLWSLLKSRDAIPSVRSIRAVLARA